MKIRKIYPKILLIPALALLLFACDKSHPGIEYAPQMYHSIPLEPFTQVDGETAPFPDSLLHQRIPPSGTVAMNAAGAYEFANETNPAADTVLPKIQAMQNPVPYSKEALAEGEVLYQRFCAVCHGKKGAGDGTISKARAEIAPAAYNSDKLKNRTQGEIYHTIMVGINVMGSYASQISYEDRWKVVHYVSTLQGNDPTASAEGATEEGAEGAGDEEAAEGEGGEAGEVAEPAETPDVMPDEPAVEEDHGGESHN